MTAVWWTVIGASIVVYLIKLSGYVVPRHVVSGPAVARVASLVTVALLASLVVSQTLALDGQIVVDARVPAIAMAGVLLWLRAPFILVIIAAAVVAAGLRSFGVMA